MNKPPQRDIGEFKKILKEGHAVEYTDSEAYEAEHNLISFFALLFQIDQRQKQKEKIQNSC